MSNNFDDYDTGDPHRRHHGRAGCKCSGGVKDNDYGDYWRFGDVADTRCPTQRDDTYSARGEDSDDAGCANGIDEGNDGEALDEGRDQGEHDEGSDSDDGRCPDDAERDKQRSGGDERRGRLGP
ncbi:hypothetical protein PF010_g13130 [Phytophthora fragariae]|uniref:Uncharacterized protein n=1 Tax=Phytophthora fragariae TaxID=53985 RepID=A0A6G0L0N6_9STRA|nr:hypothetical protein PF003_g831 [Phytophthora fragariae]KAE9105128.1 hypothetical protein PF010_g13130 [Phytophthora fragariae]